MKRLLVMAIVLTGSGCKGGAPSGGGGGSSPPAKMPQALVGEWKRTLLTFDNNANEKLDDEERKPELTMKYGYSAFKFDASGKCTMEKIDPEVKKLTGRCGIADSDGKKWLALELDQNQDELDYRYLILAQSDKELVIKDASGPKGTIYVYAR